MSENQLSHIPIMVQEVQQYLSLERGGNFLDGTFGGGGHSSSFLKNYPQIHLFAVDRDPEAKIRAEDLKSQFPLNFKFQVSRFSEIGNLSLPPMDGIFFDFGISSIQLDDPVRGFSFQSHTVMDMRMNTQEGVPAYKFLKTASESQLIQAIRDFGEERHWHKVVDFILSHRNSNDVYYADYFARRIEQLLPHNFHSKIHPATKTFQGIRIAVNQELEEIQQVLPIAFELLNPDGRLVTLSFHSLEDRIVKRFFNLKAGKAVDCHELMVDRPKLAEILTKKVITPSDDEILNNRRCRSTRLRALRKL